MKKASTFGVMIIGDEILSGRRSDKHLSHSVQILNEAGQSLSWARYCGDDLARLTRQFEQVLSEPDVCFSFGGIGGTVDDVTRQALAQALGTSLVRHEEAVSAIESQFGAKAYPHRIQMADLPEGADLIPNPYNRIPGFSINNIYCLPGFPVMAWPMMKWVLKTTFGDIERRDIVLKTLLLHQTHESDIVDVLSNIQQNHPAIKVSSLPSFSEDGNITIEIGIEGESTPVEQALQALKKQLQTLTLS